MTNSWMLEEVLLTSPSGFHRIHLDLQMTNPPVCVDPSREMLDVARKNGAITIQATAEEFFATRPKHPLKVALMHGCRAPFF